MRIKVAGIEYMSMDEVDHWLNMLHTDTLKYVGMQRELDEALCAIEVVSSHINRAAYRLSGQRLIAEITEMSAKLAAYGTHYKHIYLGHGFGGDDPELIDLLNQISDIQDAVDNAIGGDKGEALKHLHPGHSLSKGFVGISVGGRIAQMEANRLQLAELAIRKREHHPRGWWKSGCDIMQEIFDKTENEQTDFDKWVFGECIIWCFEDNGKIFVRQQAKMNSYFSNLTSDYKNRRTSRELVSREVFASKMLAEG